MYRFHSLIFIPFLNSSLLYPTTGSPGTIVYANRLFNAQTLKAFVTSMFVSYVFVFILFIMAIIRIPNPETDPSRYFNSIYMIYAIPYIIGLMFFLKIDKQPVANNG